MFFIHESAHQATHSSVVHQTSGPLNITRYLRCMRFGRLQRLPPARAPSTCLYPSTSPHPPAPLTPFSKTIILPIPPPNPDEPRAQLFRGPRLVTYARPRSRVDPHTKYARSSLPGRFCCHPQRTLFSCAPEGLRCSPGPPPMHTWAETGMIRGIMGPNGGRYFGPCVGYMRSGDVGATGGRNGGHLAGKPLRA